MNASILYRDGAACTDYATDTFLEDLRIDRIIEGIVLIKGREEISGYFRRKPKRLDDVMFRLNVMKDLERTDIRAIIQEFVRQYGFYQTYAAYSRTLPQRQTRQKWLLDAAQMYCGSLLGLQASLAGAMPQSDGLLRFLKRLGEYTRTNEFTAFRKDTQECAERLSSISYTLEICLGQNRVIIRKGDDNAGSYCDRLSAAFPQYDLSLNTNMAPFPGVNMETLELAILERLHGLYPAEFKTLEDYCQTHPAAGSPLVETFYTELQFYLSYTTYMDRLKAKGYAFAYPSFQDEKVMRIRAGYDLSLAQSDNDGITPNDFIMDAGESFIITGPNQGGKTTYARMVGQAAYLASLGLPAPCRSIELYFLKEIYTHFARDEDLSTNYGRLKEELQRAKRIIDAMPQQSMVIFNDLFSSTTTYDALQIGRKMLAGLASRGCLCLFATHFGELAEASPRFASLYAAPDETGRAYPVARIQSRQRTRPNRIISGYRLNYSEIRSMIK